MRQLGPVHEELMPYIDIELVPFGKSAVNDNFYIQNTCHSFDKEKILKFNIFYFCLWFLKQAKKQSK